MDKLIKIWHKTSFPYFYYDTKPDIMTDVVEHYLITKEQLLDVFEAGKAYRASMADNTTKAKFHDRYFKELGVE
jgi:hypothetical protein